MALCCHGHGIGCNICTFGGVKIHKIHIVTEVERDFVYLFTNLGPASWFWDEAPILHFDCPKGMAREYVNRNFPNISVKVFANGGEIGE